MTADPEIPVPPVNYGGIERIVDALVNKYAQNGHEVILVSNPGSSNKLAVAKYGWPAHRAQGSWNTIRNAIFLYKVSKEVKPSVVHSFSRLLYLYPIFFFNKVPVLQSYQRAISGRSTSIASFFAGNKLRYSSCADHMRTNQLLKEKCSVIYNFTNTSYFIPPESEIGSRDYVLFLGRIEEVKGAREAIEVALASKHKLVIAGNIQNGHEDYFEKKIKPYLDHTQIEYVGPVNDEKKRSLLQHAKALLFPIKWEEPFGIVMAEAMACGTPVMGFRRGSVHEVVKDGVTGFVVDTIDEMASSIDLIDQIDRNRVRHECVQRFSDKVISEQYLERMNLMLKSQN